jgi:hypothetical protein
VRCDDDDNEGPHDVNTEADRQRQYDYYYRRCCQRVWSCVRYHHRRRRHSLEFPHTGQQRQRCCRKQDRRRQGQRHAGWPACVDADDLSSRFNSFESFVDIWFFNHFHCAGVVYWRVYIFSHRGRRMNFCIFHSILLFHFLLHRSFRFCSLTCILVSADQTAYITRAAVVRRARRACRR